MRVLPGTTTRLTTPPTPFAANLAALLLLVAVFAGFFIVIANQIETRDRLSDFRPFHAAATSLLHGGSPYQIHTQRKYVYPPLLAWALMPLTLLDVHQAAMVWLAVNCTLALACMLLLVRTFQHRMFGSRSSPIAIPALLATLLTFGRFKAELQQLESDVIVLFAFSLALALLDRAPILAGAVLGAAFDIKYLTITALPYLLLRRRWVAAGSFLAGAVLFAVLPATTIGLPRDLQYLSRSMGGMLQAVGIHLPGAGRMQCWRYTASPIA